MATLFDGRDIELGKCPECGLLGPLTDFDCLGACVGQVLCPECSCEFDFDTGLRHQPCPQCEQCGSVVSRSNAQWDGDEVIYGGPIGLIEQQLSEAFPIHPRTRENP